MSYINPQKAWEREYVNPEFITKADKPQADLLRFLKWLKKSKLIDLYDIQLLDLGCGTGRNAFYMAETYGANVSAFDFSKGAIAFAKEHFSHPSINFSVHDIAQPFQLPGGTHNLAFDIMTSMSLIEKDRDAYLHEVERLLKPGAIMYLRTLAKEGDKNAAHLLKHNPGPEKDTYVHPTLSSIERVFSEQDLRERYSPFFEILFMEKKTGYQKFGNQSYKRNYWNVYMRKYE